MLDENVNKKFFVSLQTKANVNYYSQQINSFKPRNLTKQNLKVKLKKIPHQLRTPDTETVQC